MLEPTTEQFHQSVCEAVDTSLKQMRRDVQVLRAWIDSQPHLPRCSSDTMLTAYLVSSKNRMERAKQKIDNYYTARHSMPDFYGDRDPRNERVQECAKEMRIFTLPKLTPNGCRLTMVSFVAGDMKRYDLQAFSKRVMAQEDLRMNREAFTKGYYFVLDSTHFTMSHVLRLTPSLARQIVHCAQDVLPVTITAIIIFNAPSFMALVVNMIKPFMKSKLFQKIQIHTEGPKVLEKYFPRTMLPKDYGGEEDTRDNLNKSWLDAWEKERAWFLGEGAQGVDESKRPKTPVKGKHLDLQGSFKTICID